MNNTRSVDSFVLVENVHKSFDALEVLRGVSFRVAKGEVVCIIGPSSSGKSTLLKCINGLEHTSSGRIVVDDREVTAPHAYLPGIRQEIGMVFQGFNLFPHLSVIDNIIEGPRTVKRMRRVEALRLGRELLSTVGLGDKETSWPAKLSGGQSSGSRSRGRWRWILKSCFSTSRLRHSIQSLLTRSLTSWVASRVRV